MRNTIPWPARPDRRPLIIAHRGASGHAVENTLGAFRAAAELGADMWETDVRLTADGIPVVSHDPTLEAVLGRAGTIAELTLAELRNAVPDLPTLAEVVALAEALRQSLYLELKAPGAGTATHRLLQETAFARAALGSFDAEAIRTLADGDCPYPLAVLVRLGEDPFDKAEAARADIVHLCWERGGDRPQDLVTPALLAEAERRRLGVVLWHEERRAVLDDLQAMPVLGICTNQPELMSGFHGVPMRKISVVSHRGAHRLAPENTLASGRLAFDQGCDWLELDVRESADGEIVVIHDATLERTTNGTGRVADKTLAELRALDAGAWKSPFYRGQHIPTLREMIALCQSYGRRLYIENKSVAPARLVALVEELGFLRDCFFWSGDPALQEGLRAASPQARLKANHADYPSIAAMIGHLRPVISEMSIAEFAEHGTEYARAGITAMVKYFGEDPAVFAEIAALSPPMVNLDRSDLLLAALEARA
ncbi:glycerophosphodiester phosphodiesterase [Jiella sp. M17.18]|uniref:glycerophosphodiester phosphodiesterase n=1 Tax=Jiella sp. M17.18 TaxID=3234247 RepID=UPI0034E00A8F